MGCRGWECSYSGRRNCGVRGWEWRSGTTQRAEGDSTSAHLEELSHQHSASAQCPSLGLLCHLRAATLCAGAAGGAPVCGACPAASARALGVGVLVRPPLALAPPVGPAGGVRRDKGKPWRVVTTNTRVMHRCGGWGWDEGRQRSRWCVEDNSSKAMNRARHVPLHPVGTLPCG